MLTGGSDGVAGVYSLSQDRVIQALKGGGGSITAGTWAGTQAIISTSAGRVKCFEGSSEVASFTAHSGEATDVAVHPCGDVIASAGSDKSYVLYDLETKAVLTKVYSNSGMSALHLGHKHNTDSLQYCLVSNSIRMAISWPRAAKTAKSRYSTFDPAHKPQPSTLADQSKCFTSPRTGLGLLLSDKTLRRYRYGTCASRTRSGVSRLVVSSTLLRGTTQANSWSPSVPEAWLWSIMTKRARTGAKC